MSWPRVINRINQGELVVLHPKGNSMTPIIRSGERVVLRSVDTGALKVNDIVLAKVKGRYYLHKISRLAGLHVEISNNHGHANGWTTRNKVFALVCEVGEPTPTP